MKHLFASLFVGTALCLAAMPAYADSAARGVSLTVDGDRAAVSLQLPADEAQDVTALQMSFAVSPTASSDVASVSFEFSDALSAGVQQYRYDDATGELTLYLAGRDALLKDGSVQLGDICLTSADGTEVEADVVFLTDSLQVADRSFGSRQPDAGGAATALLSTAKPAPAPSEKPESTPAPSAKPESTPAPSADSDADSDTTEQTVQATATPTGGALTVSGTVSSGQTGGSAAGTTPAPESSPAPETTSAPEASPSPDQSPAPQTTATPAPEADADDTAPATEATSFPWVPVLLGAAAVAAIAALVIVFRRR